MVKRSLGFGNLSNARSMLLHSETSGSRPRNRVDGRGPSSTTTSCTIGPRKFSRNLTAFTRPNMNGTQMTRDRNEDQPKGIENVGDLVATIVPADSVSCS